MSEGPTGRARGMTERQKALYLFNIQGENGENRTLGVIREHNKDKDGNALPPLDYRNLTCEEMIENLKSSTIFAEGQELKYIIYKDSRYSIPIPQSAKPLALFPNLIFSSSMYNERAKLLESMPRLLLVKATSKYPYTFRITLNHSNGQLPPFVVDINLNRDAPVEDNGDDHDILTEFGAWMGNQTWADITEPAAMRMMNVDLKCHHVILRYMNKGTDMICFPFSTVAHDVAMLFQMGENSRELDTNGVFYYDIVISRKTPDPDAKKFQREIAEAEHLLIRDLSIVGESEILQVVASYLRRFFTNTYGEETDMTLLARMVGNVLTTRMLNFIGKYFGTVDFGVTGWKDLIQKVKDMKKDSENVDEEMKDREKYIDENSEGSLDVLTGLNMLAWESLPEDFVARFVHAYTWFGKKMNCQNSEFYGTVVYIGLVTLNGKYKYCLLMSRAFIIILKELPPKLNEQTTFLSLPPTITFSFETDDPVCISIPIACTEFRLMQSDRTQGVIQTNSGDFVVSFTDTSAMRDFWMMYEITKNEFLSPSVIPSVPEAEVAFSFPPGVGNSLTWRASVKVVGEEWTVHLPLLKFREKLSRKPSDTVGKYSMIDTSLDPPSVPVELRCDLEETYETFGFTNNAFAKTIKGSTPTLSPRPYHILYATCYEYTCTTNEDYQNLFLRILKATNGYQAFRLKSPKLLHWQMKYFKRHMLAFEMRKTPLLHFAAMFSDNLHLLSILVENMTDINKLDGDQRSAMFYALQNRSLGQAQMLLDHNIDSDLGDNQRLTPMTSTMDNYCIERGAFLATYGVSVNNTLRSFHQPALIYALESKRLDVFKALLPYCQDELNYPTQTGKYLTHICLEMKLEEPLMLLAQCPNFDPNLYTDQFVHPILYFLSVLSHDVQSSHMKLLDALLMLPTLNINFRDRETQTALCQGILTNQTKFVQRLIKDPRCDLELHNREGFSPLYLAVTAGNLACAKMLVDAGAMVNAPNSNSEQCTPLMSALNVKNQSRMQMIELLLANGANPNLWYNSEGKLPYDGASQEVIDLFKKYGYVRT